MSDVNDLTKNRRPSRLTYRNVSGAGKQIFGEFNVGFNCVEFKKLPGHQMIATEPWVQFEPPEWSAAMDTLFSEMVEAWNEKYGISDYDSTKKANPNE